jgi:hypothetical protein
LVVVVLVGEMVGLWWGGGVKMVGWAQGRGPLMGVVGVGVVVPLAWPLVWPLLLGLGVADGVRLRLPRRSLLTERLRESMGGLTADGKKDEILLLPL